MFELLMPNLLEGISEPRMRQFIKIETIKLISAKSGDVEKLKAVGRIWIRNPLIEIIQTYIENYNGEHRDPKSLQDIRERTLQLCDEINETYTNIITKREEFQDSIDYNDADTADAAPLRLEYESLISVLKNITQLDKTEVFIHE